MQRSVKTYCIIGDPIEHSLSPGMHNAAFAALGLNSTYIGFTVPSHELRESLESLRAINIAGFNVTVPHKVEVMRHLDELELSARKASAVNTVNNIEGLFKGYNTDIHGFIEPLRQRKVDFTGMQVLLLGAGGAARAVIVALSEQEGSLGKVIIANRDSEKANELVKIGLSLGLKCEVIDLQRAPEISSGCDMIVNATVVGMKGEPGIIGYQNIRKGSIVYDMVYRPVTTDLLENAKNAQAVVVYGYEMLIEQGAQAFEIWTGIPAPKGIMRKYLLGVFGEPA